MMKCGTFGIAALVVAASIAPVSPDCTAASAAKGHAADGGAGASGGSLKQRIFAPKPIDIRADELKVYHRERYGVFTGSVKADRGDIQLYCDELRAFYDDAGAVNRLECRGKVLAVMGAKQARGGLAVYDATADTVRITDNPVLSEGEDTMRGEVVIFNLGEDTVRIEKPRGRYRTPAAIRSGGGDGGHD